MVRRSLDVIAAMYLALLPALFPLTDLAGDGARIAYALALAFVAPGYCLTTALIPGPTIPTSWRVLLTCGMSLVIASLGGLALHLTLGLEPFTWALYLGTLTVVAGAVTILRRHAARLPGPRRPRRASPVWQYALFGLAIALAAGAFGYARSSALDQPGPTFTQLWIVPVGGQPAGTFEVGITNHEARGQTYVLRVLADGEPYGEGEVILRDGESHTELVQVAPDDVGQIVVLLYRGEDISTIYRRVTMTVEGG